MKCSLKECEQEARWKPIFLVRPLVRGPRWEPHMVARADLLGAAPGKPGFGVCDAHRQTVNPQEFFADPEGRTRIRNAFVAQRLPEPDLDEVGLDWERLP